MSMTLFHPVGTTQMGPNNDPTAVVDPQLKVKNVHAGVISRIISANTNPAPTMVGERGADFVKRDWNYPKKMIHGFDCKLFDI